VSNTRALVLGCVVTAGVLLSLAIGFGSAFALGGAGHGWCSSLWSVLTVIYVPVLAAGFLAHSPTTLRRLATYVTRACIGVDAMLVIATSVEGWSSVGRVWEAVPSLLAGWAIVWTGLHIFVVLLWLRAVHISEQDGASNGSQPIRSETNRTSSAAGSRR
jgi:hypothetical protein